MQASAGLICRIVKFSSGMECRKYQPGCRHSLFMHPHRDTTAVIIHCGRAVRLQRYLDPVTETGQMFIHRVIHDLIDQMIQSLGGHAAYLHTRTLPHCLQAFQDRDTAGVISGRLCHSHFLSKHTFVFSKSALTI